MARRPDPTDLKARRQRLDLAVEAMATGISLPVRTVNQIEALQAPNAELQHYANWLARIEGWTPEERKARFDRAARGMRFL